MDDKLNTAEQAMNEAKADLLASGITVAQLGPMVKYIHAAIAFEARTVSTPGGYTPRGPRKGRTEPRISFSDV